MTTTSTIDSSSTAVAAPATRPSPAASAGWLTTTLAVGRRTIRKFLRTPQLVVISSVQGAMFLLIFRYVFGGAISVGPVPYVDFLVPGFIVTGVLFSGMMSAAGVAEDVDDGFFDRLRSLPVSRNALLMGRALADTATVAWGLVVVALLGFAIGFRMQGSWEQAAAAFGLCIVFGFAFIWVFITIGLYAGNAQAAQGMSMLVFPLTFVSSAYVPVDSMPGWMQPIAEHQPVTAMVDAVRVLALGDPARAGLTGSTAHYVVLALAWSALLVVLFAPIAVRRYRRG